MIFCLKKQSQSISMQFLFSNLLFYSEHLQLSLVYILSLSVLYAGLIRSVFSPIQRDQAFASGHFKTEF